MNMPPLLFPGNNRRDESLSECQTRAMFGVIPTHEGLCLSVPDFAKQVDRARMEAIIHDGGYGSPCGETIRGHTLSATKDANTASSGSSYPPTHVPPPGVSGLRELYALVKGV
jgi:hypothetical protein